MTLMINYYDNSQDVEYVFILGCYMYIVSKIENWLNIVDFLDNLRIFLSTK